MNLVSKMGAVTIADECGNGTVNVLFFVKILLVVENDSKAANLLYFVKLRLCVIKNTVAVGFLVNRYLSSLCN